jgi:hypothetical protein
MSVLKVQSAHTYMLLPVFRLRNQALAPAVRPRDLESVHYRRTLAQRKAAKSQCLRPEGVDQIAKTLPHSSESQHCPPSCVYIDLQHIGHSEREIVRKAGLGIGLFDICEWVRKGHSRGPWHRCEGLFSLPRS